MSMIMIFVGLDDHQASVQVCVLDRQGNVLTNRACDNDIGETGVLSLVDRSKRAR